MSSSSTPWSLARGVLVGAAEALPGTSGGTIALVTGVYETAVTGAGHTVAALRHVVTDRARARAELRRVRWPVIVPLLIGMVPGLLVTVRFVAPLLEEHPVPVYALFLGMTAAALTVPLRMIGTRWRARELGGAALVAVAVFLLVGLPPQHLEPTWPVVFLAAAVAACALALPGTSGSFLLLTFGLYQPTLAALNDRDWGYVAVFVAGIAVGLGCFVSGLQWLLEHRRRGTLVLMSGVVLGALRALWPWQTDDRVLLAPDVQVALAVLTCAVGAAGVLGLAALSRRVEARRPTPEAVETR
jgi:putative membrane protein